MLTARDTLDDKLKGFTAGTDDYLHRANLYRATKDDNAEI
jgi:DNA-binding response OmpR family regulator